jgi:hypothetical protein
LLAVAGTAMPIQRDGRQGVALVGIDSTSATETRTSHVSQLGALGFLLRDQNESAGSQQQQKYFSRESDKTPPKLTVLIG